MSERTNGEADQNHLPALSKLKLIGGAAAASLALLASGCSSGSETATESYNKPNHPDAAGEKKYNPRTEAALKEVIKPATVRYAKTIMQLAEEYPDNTIVQQSKDTISVNVSDSVTYPGQNEQWTKYSVSLDMTTRREGNSPDPTNVLSLGVTRSTDARDPANSYSESFDLYSTYTTHPLGWGAEEYIDYGVGNGGFMQDTDGARPWPHSAQASSIAKRIVQDANTIISGAQNDLRYGL